MANTRLQKTEKIGCHKYRRMGCSVNRKFSFGIDAGFILVEHKGKPRVALVFNDPEVRVFYTRHVIGPQKARLLIGWLAKYIALSDPDPISLSIASTKAHAKLIQHEQNKIASELGLK